MGDGVFHLGEVEVWVKEGVCRNREGALAGSSLEMDQGLALFYQETHASYLALAQVSAGNPLRLLGFADPSPLEPGSIADLCLWDNEANKLHLKSLIKEGKSLLKTD